MSPSSPIPRWSSNRWQVAEALAREGILAEVVDIRCLNPLDDETFIASAKKTGRAMVVTEAVMTSGFAAELSARISERCSISGRAGGARGG